jgi:UDP-glucose 4-epimerase
MEGDLGNHGLIREAVSEIDIVYHFVSTTLPKTSNDDPIYDVRSNLLDTIQLLESCVEARVNKVVFASSGGTVYGPPETLPVVEDHPTRPMSSYGIVKLAIEKYLELFYRLYDLDYTALRISNPYGPYQNPDGMQGAVSVFLYRLYTGRPITVWGNGEVVRDYLYIADLIDALELAAKTQTRQKVMNIGSGEGVSLNYLLECISVVTGKTPTLEYLSTRLVDVPANVLDIGRARAELGWIPEVRLAEGVNRTWNWIQTL